VQDGRNDEGLAAFRAFSRVVAGSHLKVRKLLLHLLLTPFYLYFDTLKTFSQYKKSALFKADFLPGG